MFDSTQKAITAKPRGMGRPPIGKFTAVRLSDDMLARIDAFAPQGKRADFIREAVERELQLREKGADPIVEAVLQEIERRTKAP